MKHNINETMSKYNAGEITLEQANEELKKAEAGFHLDPKKNVLTEEERTAQEQREDEEGFIPATEEAEVLPKTPDMRRRKELAGQVVRQRTKAGRYDVTYGEDGYAVKAKRVQMA